MPKSSTWSHGMCSATDGASDVSRLTSAASAIFSNGSRGTPGWANTLNLVPEFPNAHDGSSMSRVLMPSATNWSIIPALLSRSRQVEHLLERSHLLVGRCIAGGEVGRHQRLPSSVHRLILHRRDGGGERARRLEVAEQLAVAVEEQ